MIKKILKSKILFDLYNAYKLHRFQIDWRKHNGENDTTANNIFDPNIVDVGRASYGELNIISFASKSHLHIGSFVSIAQEVAFILDAEYYTSHISTYPYKVKYLGVEKEEAFSKGDIFIDDDVWIGYRSTIMEVLLQRMCRRMRLLVEFLQKLSDIDLTMKLVNLHRG